MKRRSFSVALALTVILSGVPATGPVFAAESREAAVEASASAALTGGDRDGGFGVSVTAQGSGEAVLAAAVYEKETARLVKVSRAEVSLPAEKTLVIPYDRESQYVKGFFWEKDSARPLTAAIDSRTQAEGESKVPLSTANVWATDRQDSHPVAAMLDGDDRTYMAGQARTGAPLYIYADLGGLWDLSRLELGFDSVNGERSYALDIFASADGESYRMALEDQHTSRDSSLPASYRLSGKASHLKIAVYGYDDKNGQWNENGWVRVTHLAVYASPNDGGQRLVLAEDYSGMAGTISSSDNGDRWFAYALDEETYTDYTPSTGSDLLADYAVLPEDAGLGSGNKALRLHDRADRASGDGRGAIGAFRRLPSTEGDFTLSFKLYIPADSENIYWSGLSLLNGKVTGGADLTPAAALQLRFSADGDGAAVNVLDSVQFNEGELRRLFDNRFRLGTAWNVTLKVSPSGKRTQITIDDGVISETQLIGYNYTDVERVNNQTWQNAAVNCLALNTGAGGKLDLYLDDLTLSYDGGRDSGAETVFYQSFDGLEQLSDAGVQQAVVLKNADGSTGGSSLGPGLTASIGEAYGFDGQALRITDYNSRDGLVAAMPLTLPNNNHKYIIKWKMRDNRSRSYSGFSLASGFNRGMTDVDHPMALQLRYSMQDNNTRIQFNNYNSIRFNDEGRNFGAFMGTGGSRFKAGNILEIEITVSPVARMMDISISDGELTLTRTYPFETQGSYGGGEDWSGRRPDTILFHTAAGGESDCVADDVEVIDTGIEDHSSSEAVMGLVRLESVFGTGRFMTAGGERPANTESADPNMTRFVERPGLADPKGVSLECASQPGLYLCAEETDDEGHAYVLTLKKPDGSAQDRAFATFYKSDAEADSYYHGSQKLYSPIWDAARCINYDGGKNCQYSISVPSPERSGRFYLRSEALNFVSDNFKGDKLNSQWWTNLPWKGNNPTNDSYNFTALIDHRNVIVGNGELLLKATKIGENDWSNNAKNISGEDGKWYNNEYGKNGYYKWAGRVGVVSIRDKVYNKECLIEGSFKQPDSPVGYWNAFWLAGRDSWPPEIDIFEFLSSNFGPASWNANIHGENDRGNLFGRSSMDGVDLTKGYHTFAMDWGYNYLRLYVDGKCYQQQNGSSPALDFQKNMRLILNTGVGGWETEPNDSMKWNDGLRCRWIRSFQY